MFGVEETPLGIDTTSSALLTSDIPLDFLRMSTGAGPLTPADLHALASLSEAALLHEYVFVPCTYEGFDLETNEMLGPLIREGVLDTGGSSAVRSELTQRGLSGDQFFLDITWRAFLYPSHGTAFPSFLELLTDAHTNVGLDSISEAYDSHLGSELVDFLLSRAIGGNSDDVQWLDGVNRYVRALAGAATQLGLDIYTGVILRPLLHGRWKVQRDAALLLFERMKTELEEEIEEADTPGWERIAVPFAAQLVLGRCRGDLNAFAHELLDLRERHSAFRVSLAQYRHEWRSAETRGERRKLRRELQGTFNSLTAKDELVESRTTRLLHRVINVVKKPTPNAIFAELAAGAVDKVALDAAIERIDGLTDLWAELKATPTLDKTLELMLATFRYDADPQFWARVSKLAVTLETAMLSDGRETPSLLDV